MKKKLMLGLMMAFVANVVMAAEVKVGDYQFNTDTGAITRYCGDCSDVEIPSTIGGVAVKSICEVAFRSCTKLLVVTIPSGVTSIGDYAFENCSGLMSVTIPSSVTRIGDGVFNGCKGLTSVTIPEGVTRIGDCAFMGCKGLTSVTMPLGVTSIGDEAFKGCKGLTSVTIPEGVTSIGGAAFLGCSRLTSVTIPSSMKSIGKRAFEDCGGLTSVTIPKGVTCIGNYVFKGTPWWNHKKNVEKFVKIASGACTVGLILFVGGWWLYQRHLKKEMKERNVTTKEELKMVIAKEAEELRRKREKELRREHEEELKRKHEEELKRTQEEEQLKSLEHIIYDPVRIYMKEHNLSPGDVAGTLGKNELSFCFWVYGVAFTLLYGLLGFLFWRSVHLSFGASCVLGFLIFLVFVLWQLYLGVSAAGTKGFFRVIFGWLVVGVVGFVVLSSILGVRVYRERENTSYYQRGW